MPRTCGTTSGYTGGCRCEPCRLAHQVTQSAYRARKKAGVKAERPPVKHGTLYRYRCGCRCEPCVDAKHRENRRYTSTDRKPREAPAPKAQPKPVVRFEHDLVNLAHALTLEDWQAREAADPSCRPVTQARMQLRAERMSAATDGLTPFERIIAEGTL